MSGRKAAPDPRSTVQPIVDPLLSKIGKLVDRVDAAPAKLFETHRNSLPMRAISALSEMGDQPQLRTASGAVIAVGLLAGDRRLARTGLRVLLAHELATLMKSSIKDRVDRARPRSAQSAEDRKPSAGTHKAKELTSFPSGHTAGSVAAARAAARDYPEHARVLYAAAGGIAGAQVPRCAHYPTDIAAGLLIGLIAETVAALIVPATNPAA